MCLGYYTDVAGEQQALDLQFKNVYFAPECAFNLLSLNRLNEENINLNTGIKSLIFPAPEDMMIPSDKEPIFYEYESWTMHQTKDHMGYPAFRAQYKCGKNITLTGWLNISGLKWEAQNNILALKDHPTNETNQGIRHEFSNISPDIEFPDTTFMWHLATGAPCWSLRRMIKNPAVYRDMEIMLHAAKWWKKTQARFWPRRPGIPIASWMGA